MDWGKKIAIVYIGFVVFMLTLVTLCIKQKDINLVSDDYYAQELEYESTLAKKRNSNELIEEVTITEDQKTVSINLGKASVGSKGQIVFYRPSNPSLDFIIPLVVNSNGTQILDLSTKKTGLWTVKVDWEKEGKQYYKEQKIQI